MKKILLTSAIAISLTATSIATFVFANDTGSQAQGKAVILPDTLAVQADNTEVKDVNGNIQYKKEISLRADGSVWNISETWTDPKTLEMRQDSRFTPTSGPRSNTSFYLKDGARSIVTINRDSEGKAVSGTHTACNQIAADMNNALFDKYNSFDAVKAQYTKEEWKNEGIVANPDGTSLKKLTKSFETSNKKFNDPSTKKVELVKTQAQEIVYVDVSTGFPVKRELYMENDGIMKVESTTLYEFKYVKDDGKLFDISGVTLEETEPFNADGNEVG